jgi:hypothetical protein
MRPRIGPAGSARVGESDQRPLRAVSGRDSPLDGITLGPLLSANGFPTTGLGRRCRPLAHSERHGTHHLFATRRRRLDTGIAAFPNERSVDVHGAELSVLVESTGVALTPDQKEFCELWLGAKGKL